MRPFTRLALIVSALFLVVASWAVLGRVEARPGPGGPGLALTATLTSTRGPYLPLVVQPPRTTIAPTHIATATVTVTAPMTPTAQAGAINIKINDVVCRKPTDDPTFEYIELVNKGSNKVDISGWKVVNISLSNATYTFPAYTLPAGPDVYVVVYGGTGTTRLDFGEFYWGDNTQIWHIGDKVELRNASNVPVTSLTVPAASCS